MGFKNGEKNTEEFFVSYISASQLFAFNCPH